MSTLMAEKECRRYGITLRYGTADDGSPSGDKYLWRAVGSHPETGEEYYAEARYPLLAVGTVVDQLRSAGVEPGEDPGVPGPTGENHG